MGSLDYNYFCGCCILFVRWFFFLLRYIFLEDNDFFICYISMELFRIVLFVSDVFWRFNDIYLKLEWKGNEDIKF